jgi:hypothetical protein
VLDACDVPRSRARLAGTPSVRAEVEALAGELAHRGLLVGADARARLRRWGCPLLAVCVLGAARLVARIGGGRPVGLLVALLVPAAAATWWWFRAIPTRTVDGEAELARLRDEHGYLSPAMRPDRVVYGTAAAALGVGLFGAGAVGVGLFGAGALWAVDPVFADELEVEPAPVAGSGGSGGSGGTDGSDGSGGGILWSPGPSCGGGAPEPGAEEPGTAYLAGYLTGGPTLAVLAALTALCEAGAARVGDRGCERTVAPDGGDERPALRTPSSPSSRPRPTGPSWWAAPGCGPRWRTSGPTWRAGGCCCARPSAVLDATSGAMALAFAVGAARTLAVPPRAGPSAPCSYRCWSPASQRAHGGRRAGPSAGAGAGRRAVRPAAGRAGRGRLPHRAARPHRLLAAGCRSTWRTCTPTRATGAPTRPRCPTGCRWSGWPTCVAGGHERGGLYHDTHTAPTPPAVLELLGALCRRTRPPALLLERDGHYPPAAELHAELDAVAAAAGVAATTPPAPEVLR